MDSWEGNAVATQEALRTLPCLYLSLASENKVMIFVLIGSHVGELAFFDVSHTT